MENTLLNAQKAHADLGLRHIIKKGIQTSL